MHGRLFTLVSTKDYDQIFAWGIEITHGDEVEAVIYRRDPVTRETTFAVHSSAEAARALHSRMLRRVLAKGLLLVWMDGENDFAELFDSEPEPVLV